MTQSVWSFYFKTPKPAEATGWGCLRPSDTLSWLWLQRMNHQDLPGISRTALHKEWAQGALPWGGFCLLATGKWCKLFILHKPKESIFIQQRFPEIAPGIFNRASILCRVAGYISARTKTHVEYFLFYSFLPMWVQQPKPTDPKLNSSMVQSKPGESWMQPTPNLFDTKSAKNNKFVYSNTRLAAKG